MLDLISAESLWKVSLILYRGKSISGSAITVELEVLWSLNKPVIVVFIRSWVIDKAALSTCNSISDGHFLGWDIASFVGLNRNIWDYGKPRYLTSTFVEVIIIDSPLLISLFSSSFTTNNKICGRLNYFLPTALAWFRSWSLLKHLDNLVEVLVKEIGIFLG